MNQGTQTTKHILLYEVPGVKQIVPGKGGVRILQLVRCGKRYHFILLKSWFFHVVVYKGNEIRKQLMSGLEEQLEW